MNTVATHATEVTSGARFEFGANWVRFLSVLNEERIAQAEKSLKTMLEVENFEGKKFIDVGSGSGLFSLAARRLGAEVYSFDYDPQSVACTQELKRRYFPSDPKWQVNHGSVLDRDYLRTLGQYDIVYSWGVLHHTGRMWEALENVATLVAPAGILFISIYNDQGRRSRNWKFIKKTFNHLPMSLRVPYVLLIMAPRHIRSFLYWCISCLRGKPSSFIKDIRNYSSTSLRGMSYWHDVIDWVGGYPFEVAKPEEIFDFFKMRGYELEKISTCGGGHGCNQYVFRCNRTTAS